MNSLDRSYRVAVVGASSLLGKELIATLKERNFPVSQIVRMASEAPDPELPILDLDGTAEDLLPLPQEEVKQSELDFAFLASRPRAGGASPAWLRDPGSASRCTVIDLGDELGESRAEGTGKAGDWVLSAPFLDREFPAASGPPESRRFVSAHPASIILSVLLLRLSRSVLIEHAVAHVFGPVSEIGPRAIEELQRQTVNLLSFQKIPEAVFGSQLAFNVLPRLGRHRRGTQNYRDELIDLDRHVRSQLRNYLAGRASLPALRVVQAPVFYSLAVSLYLETARAVSSEFVAQSLAGERIRLTKLSEQAPSQVQVTGSSDILVDAIATDAAHPCGIWIWATGDNMRLAAVNAVEIAERVSGSSLA
jgi:aspartate-semialdehyde dehydrogenase